MSGWALGGLCLALFIAGFNIGQDYKKGFFGRKKKHKYYISGMYSIAGTIMFAGWTSEFNSEITSEELKKIKEKEEKKMKDKYKTSDATFGIIYIKKLKD
ncbi:hypothetical protein KSU03_09460 [Fusobacterium polymorphum]|uniref:Uncharacterized protein n=1 Tax=Fusobacterium nucleatum subsp. polymorphum TaxID=76857 RepID=A0A2C6B1U2_FUSNP|nr:hypothetical protein [Fusobacterium polymorphum]PHI08359.1 hypothetical protein CBG52_09325 [Fusobacterium polymorphum]